MWRGPESPLHCGFPRGPPLDLFPIHHAQVGVGVRATIGSSGCGWVEGGGDDGGKMK